MTDFRWTNKGLLANVAGKGVRMAAAETLSRAVALCPQDTGTLARSITMRRLDDDHYQVGTPVHYAPFVEFGTRRMRAQPYLGPALEQARRKYG